MSSWRARAIESRSTSPGATRRPATTCAPAAGPRSTTRSVRTTLGGPDDPLQARARLDLVPGLPPGRDHAAERSYEAPAERLPRVRHGGRDRPGGAPGAAPP